MNERIHQIAEQVYGSAATEQEIKFAEAIVRECAELMPQDNLYKMVLKHFGVEK